MTDRGSTIGEDLFVRKVKLNIPALMKGRTHISEKETIELKCIASVRVHVERAIVRLKITEFWTQQFLWNLWNIWIKL